MANNTNGTCMKGKCNGQPGRPTKAAIAQEEAKQQCDTFSGCPSVQYCTIQSKCRKACDKTKAICSGGKCGPQ